MNTSVERESFSRSVRPLGTLITLACRSARERNGSGTPPGKPLFVVLCRLSSPIAKFLKLRARSQRIMQFASARVNYQRVGAKLTPVRHEADAEECRGRPRHGASIGGAAARPAEIATKVGIATGHRRLSDGSKRKCSPSCA